MNKRKKSKLGFFIVVALIIYFAYTIISQQKLLNNKKAALNAANDKYKQEQKINKDLNDEKGKVNSDEYYEKVAREQLGMVKPGEKIFVDPNK
ncbi:MAG: septum formation initiator family protein [Bacillota bacterium]|nr:septum formation initiator family protein [Bacillota bacterium]